MKTIATLALVTLSVFSFGQNVDDLRGIAGQVISGFDARKEKDSISKETIRYNLDQPNVNLVDARAVIRPVKEDRIGMFDEPSKQQGWLKSRIEGTLTAIHAHPVWDDGDIDNESASRAHQRQNKDVDQSTVPAEGKIVYRSFILEYVFIDFQKDGDVGGAIGSWLNQASFHVSRQTAYYGLQVTVRNGDTGEGLAVYRTLGSASTADNVGANITQGLFNRRGVDIQINNNSEESRRYQAQAKALDQMKSVFKIKCTA
jgi:hypothetical protein